MGAQTLEQAAHAQKTPAARHAALVRFAAAHPNDRDGALALFAAAINDRAERRPDELIRHLRAALPRLPMLADYIVYNIAAAEIDLGNFAAVEADLQPVWNSKPSSPLAGDAAMLGARAYNESGNPGEAVRLLRANYKDLPQPEGDLLLAQCFRSGNDLVSAAGHYQRVYYSYPSTPEAEQAATALRELKTAMGELFPPAQPQQLLQRADRWAQAGEYRSAKSEYDALAAQLSGAERDTARVRSAVMDYQSYSTTTAYSRLRSLDVASPEADAERLYYMAECARRLERDEGVSEAITKLERYPSSPWRMRALLAAGNYFLVRNQPEQYVPLYKACYADFAEQPRADYCQWKIAWWAYMNRRDEARERLRDHLIRYPGSGRGSTALYFLGRLEEAAGATNNARAYYEEILNRFSNHYYAGLAERRLADAAMLGSTASPEVGQFLRTIVWPVPKPSPKFTASPATQARIERARLLDRAGLEDLTERELRFGARVENQPHVLAMELAQAASKYDSAFRALRLMKSLVPGYLLISYDDAPKSFWRLLYPLPWRASLIRYARVQGLDPYVVAGLIRQESEFNPNALSPANAYGLTQVMPSTGRQLLKVSRRRFRPSVLFQPELNLRLGTTYLRNVVDSYGGKWEMALAAYNAGPMRVQNWMTWAQYGEPAEFVENIPFTETREYVTAVLRNAEMYRRLYSDEGVEALSKPGSETTLKREGPYKRSPVVKSKSHRKKHKRSAANERK